MHVGRSMFELSQCWGFKCAHHCFDGTNPIATWVWLSTNRQPDIVKAVILKIEAVVTITAAGFTFEQLKTAFCGIRQGAVVAFHPEVKRGVGC